MFEREIAVDAIHEVLRTGEVIEERADDLPYPSRLVLGFVGGRPLHVVVADDRDAERSIVVTVYEPDPALWRAGFKRRRKP